MQLTRGRLFFVPLYYWRTILLTSSVALAVAAIFHDALAVMLSTLACAFVFMEYERRRWISVSVHFQMGDILFRVGLVLLLVFRLA